MADLGDLLAPAIVAPPVPGTGPELVKYAGGRRALAQQLSGLEGPPGPRRKWTGTDAAYDEALKTWRSAYQSARRYDTEAGQRRLAPKLSPARKGVIRRQATIRKAGLLRRRGARARMKARVRIDTPKARGGFDERDKTMPPEGDPVGVYIEPKDIGAVIDMLQRGNTTDAGERFGKDFLAAYGMPTRAYIVHVYWLRIWAEGQAEGS